MSWHDAGLQVVQKILLDARFRGIINISVGRGYYSTREFPESAVYTPWDLKQKMESLICRTEQ